jgi:hypothetical protein
MRSVKLLFTGLGLIIGLAVFPQQYFVVEKLGKMKNIKYELNDEISFQTRNGDFLINGTITQLTDSSITIDTHYTIDLENIAIVFKKRKFLKRLSGLFFIRGGIAYTVIVGINGAINNDSPMIDEQTLIISASMVAIGFALKPFIIKKMKIPEKWQLKVIDFDNVGDGGW